MVTNQFYIYFFIFIFSLFLYFYIYFYIFTLFNIYIANHNCLLHELKKTILWWNLFWQIYLLAKCSWVQITTNFLVFPQISFTSVLGKHLILWLVVSFGKSRSFVFPKFLLDIPQLLKLKLHYWENTKTTVFGPSPDWRVARREVPWRTYPQPYNYPTVENSNVQLFNVFILF